MEPYELHAAITSHHQLFARQDSVEETWRVVQPLLGDPPKVRSYQRLSGDRRHQPINDTGEAAQNLHDDLAGIMPGGVGRCAGGRAEYRMR